MVIRDAEPVLIGMPANSFPPRLSAEFLLPARGAERCASAGGQREASWANSCHLTELSAVSKLTL